jgi:hypothetical protein
MVAICWFPSGLMVAICWFPSESKKSKATRFPVGSPVRTQRRYECQRLNISTVRVRVIELPTLEASIEASESDSTVLARKSGVSWHRDEQHKAAKQPIVKCGNANSLFHGSPENNQEDLPPTHAKTEVEIDHDPLHFLNGSTGQAPNGTGRYKIRN